MEFKRAVELIRIEKKCVMRNATSTCDRDCVKCDLVQEDTDLIEAFQMAIFALEKIINEEDVTVWEDMYQVYRKTGNTMTLLASDMSIENVVIFIEAWFGRNYNDQESSLVVSRQPLKDPES